MSDNDDNASGLGRWWYASGLLIAVVLIGLAYLLISPRHTHTTASTPTTAQTTTTATSPPANSSRSTNLRSTTTTPSSPTGWEDPGCNGTPGNSTIPTTAPTGITWVPLGSMSVPTSRTLGPALVNGPLRECFAHSPSGAVLAADNIVSEAGVGPLTADEAVITAQITPGPGRNQWLEDAQGDPSGGSASMQGFRIAACDPTRCLTSLLVSGDGYYLTLDVPMVWTGRDWEIDGSAPVPSPPLSQFAPAGFIRCSAQGA